MADSLKKPVLAARKSSVAASTRRPRAERDRLNCRIDSRIKRRAEDAANILGQDLSTFTESALNEKAGQVLEQEERLVLSERDFARFMESIDNPPVPNAKLIETAKRYKAVRREHPELNW